MYMNTVCTAVANPGPDWSSWRTQNVFRFTSPPYH